MAASPDGVAPFHNRNDLLRTTVNHLSDLTVMKKTGRKLNLHDQHLQLVIDTVPALLAYVGKDERYRLVNAAYETWFERPREDIVGRTVSEVHGNAYAGMQQYIARALNGEQISYEHTVHGDSGDRHAMVAYTPDIDADGRVRGFSSMIMDITEHMHGEQVLREKEKQLLLITDAVPV